MSVFHVAVAILFVFNFIPSGIFQTTISPEKCEKQGSFEIVDGTCQNYYMCIFNGVELVAYEFKCAPSTVFSPVTGYCTPSAQFPCTQTTVPATSTSEASSSSSKSTESSSPLPTTTAPVSSSSTVPTTSSTATTTTKPACLTTGRFPIAGSSCKMYYYCYVDGTNIINYTNLTCPTVLVFNPNVQKCVLPTTYACPS